MSENPHSIDPFEIFKAGLMLEGTKPPKPVDVLFFHSRAFGDETGLFELASALYHEGLVKQVILPNTEGEREGSFIPFEANRGKIAYTSDLVQMGVSKKDILYGGSGKNTKTESEGFLALAKEKSWNTAVVLAQPHQILRAILGLVKSMEQQNYWIYAYPVIPSYTPWQEVVSGSQGFEKKTREEHIRDEYDRIVRYQQQGYLASFDELFNYLRRCELGVLKEISQIK